MCGVHVIFDKKSKLDDQPVRQMVSCSHHRGPDDSDWKTINTLQGTWYFGANRLMITDDTISGSQPMTFDNDSLVFNGEIYNSAILKNELLQSGVTFNSFSDTEILHKFLQANGTDTLSDLHGMFAFAFFDSTSETTWIARDPRGMKPLYYFENDDYFIASSEIKAILSTGLVAKKLEEQAVRDYLTWKYVVAPLTFYKNIYCLKPGEVKGIGNENIRTKTIEQPARHTQECADPVDNAEILLTESVLNHIPEKLPFSLLLSGGIDSTLLLAILDKQGVHIPTFSFCSSESDRKYGTQDFKYARMAAKQYRADHHIIESDRNTILESLDDYVNTIDQPIGDSAGIITWHLCQSIGENMKVTWSGAGADELFAGYNRHAAFKFYLTRYDFLLKFRRAGTWMSKKLPLGTQASKFLESIDKNPSTTFLNFCKLLDVPVQSEWDDVVQNKMEMHLRKALDHDLTQYLIDDVLMINDTMGMRSGVEIRAPYLDTRLVNWSQQIPAKQKLAHGTKWILGDLLKKMDGKKYVNRKKEGFGLPIKEWINDQTRNHWSFTNPNSILYKFVTQRDIDCMIDDHLSGKRNYGPELWAILILAKWLQKEFNQ